MTVLLFFNRAAAVAMAMAIAVEILGRTAAAATVATILLCQPGYPLVN